jgi:His/Glu/Gln/Arg/opine family amino acid ABC transporter permease subunit
MNLDWSVIPQNLDYFLKGAELTLFIAAISIAIGFLGGLLVGSCRLSKNPIIYGVSTVYVEAFRGTPLLIQIFLVFLGLPQILGFEFNALTAGLIALSMNSAAYQAEIFRGGVQSIPKGQMEASRSLGMNYYQSMFNVVIPQALRNALPPYTNEFITMIKDSSLVMTIGVLELTLTGRFVISKTFQPFVVFLFVALLYFIITFSTARILMYVEKRFAIPGMMGAE